jgi:Na+-transporting methylmalonyl-CoA/oxaloacetate decarboxylase gamma subunit
MGENISIGESLIIALTSILVVFLILLLISFLINRLQAFGKSEQKNTNVETKNTLTKTFDIENESIEDKLNEELVAVIAAAIACSTGNKVENIKISTIKRIPAEISEWKRAAQLEQIFNKI